MAEHCKVGPDYPEFVERDGRRYSVSVDTDRDGMIEYFHLIDILTEEMFFEADYQISSLTEAQIWEIVAEYEDPADDSYPERLPSAEGLEKYAELRRERAESAPEATVLFENEDRGFFEGLLDDRYPQYGDLGHEFRDEAIDALRRNRNESRAFQDILLDELAEEFEED